MTVVAEPSESRRISSSARALAKRLQLPADAGEPIELCVVRDGAWEVLFCGPCGRLDLEWVASLATDKPLTLFNYRVANLPAAGAAADSVAARPREVNWLSDPDPPALHAAGLHDIVVGWPRVDGDGGADLPVSFQAEVAEGPSWTPARVQLQRLRDSADEAQLRKAEARGSGASPLRFVALPPVGDARGAKIVDLRPATWYHVRLRATYGGGATCVGRPVTVATKCGPPDTPLPRPRVSEEDAAAPVRARRAGPDSPQSVALLTLGAAVREHRGGDGAPRAWRLRVSWARPRCNGYPITHYVLQQREHVLPAFIAPPSQGLFAPGEAPQCAAWTPWRTVHSHPLPECLARAPADDATAIAAAKKALGLGAPANNTSMAALQARVTGQPSESAPTIFEVEFRVAAVNSLGASDFSKATRATARECPHALCGTCDAGDGTTAPTLEAAPRASVLEAELDDLAAALDFPVSLDVVHGALLATRAATASSPTARPDRRADAKPGRVDVKPGRRKKARPPVTAADLAEATPAQRALASSMCKAQRAPDLADHGMSLLGPLR
ncbi:hypothetical protein M885DRAFT_458808 [Pelagophyceae sp. CCMP2097]|nr:hypothetical protein M885DRAFT_458808 [Pelagophyceae sp. CCMP2097]